MRIIYSQKENNEEMQMSDCQRFESVDHKREERPQREDEKAQSGRKERIRDFF